MEIELNVVGLKAELFPIPRTGFKERLERLTPDWLASAILDRWGSMIVAEAKKEVKSPAHVRDRQEKILVFRMGQLGDMIVALPAMWAVRKRWPNAHLTLLCDVHPNQKYVLARDIFEGAGLFDSFELYEVPGEPDGFRRLSLKLKLLWRLRVRVLKRWLILRRQYGRHVRSAVIADLFQAAGVKRFFGMNGLEIPRKKPGLPLRSLGREADLLLSRLANDDVTVPEANQGSLELGLGVTEEDRSTSGGTDCLRMVGAGGWVSDRLQRCRPSDGPKSDLPK